MGLRGVGKFDVGIFKNMAVILQKHFFNATITLGHASLLSDDPSVLRQVIKMGL